MTPPEVDEHAKFEAERKFALPPGLHVPIAARDEEAIVRLVGKIQAVVVSPDRAFVVEAYEPQSVNPNLPIWSLARSPILHSSRQLWVDVDLTVYRKAYVSAFPEEDMTRQVLDHVLNRRVARLKGFKYLRLVPISRAANSSSGGLSERWAVAYHSTSRMRRINKENLARIQYADLSDIVKMLDIKTGGSLQAPVNEAQKLLIEQ